MSPVKLIQKSFRSIGLEVVPHPPSDWVRCRDSLRRILNRLSIDCVFDVGANRGQYGDLLRDIGYQGTIISFEPVKELFEELSLRAAARPPWKAFHYALGATDGEASINVNQDSVLSSFLTVQDNLEECPNSRAIRSETVQVRRLDTIFADTLSGLSPKNLHLKLDTQGFDLEALKGAEGVLSRFGSAQSEVSFVPVYKNMPDYIESLQAFQACGFGVADFMPVLRDKRELLMIEMDCLFVRSESAPKR